MGLGAVPRELMETQYGREYDYREAMRQDPMRAMQFMQGFAPQYQAGSTQVGKTYGMPVDPLQQGLAAGLGAYASLMPGQAPYGYGAKTTAGTTTG